METELIRLNQAADLAEKVFVDGAPEEYLVDAMISHARRLATLFEEMKASLPLFSPTEKATCTKARHPRDEAARPNADSGDP